MERFLAFLEGELIDLAARSYEQMGHPRPTLLHSRDAATAPD
jgi:hypothetical protein